MRKKATTKKTTLSADAKMSKKKFVERAIKTLRDPKYKGIHVVYSGFNQAFREYYNEDSRSYVDELVGEGFLTSRVARGGIIITLADGTEKQKDTTSALVKILTSKEQ